MLPVEQRLPPAGNPGASLYVRRPRQRGPRCRRRHTERLAAQRADASAGIGRRAARVHRASAGSDRRLPAGRRRAPGASRRDRNTGCRDRSGCTRRPGCGTRRTGTDGLEGPTTPPDCAGSAGRSRPSAPHCCGTAFIGTVSGAARSSSCQAREDRRRAHLLRHRLVVPRLVPVAPGEARADDRTSRRADLDPHHPAAAGSPLGSTSPASAWPPCRAARQTHSLIDQSIGSQCTAPLSNEN